MELTKKSGDSLILIQKSLLKCYFFIIFPFVNLVVQCNVKKGNTCLSLNTVVNKELSACNSQSRQTAEAEKFCYLQKNL